MSFVIIEDSLDQYSIGLNVDGSTHILESGFQSHAAALDHLLLRLSTLLGDPIKTAPWKSPDDSSTSDKPPMWTLDSALELVRRLQPKLRPFDFHLALGGGVLNTGVSHNDLDLYVLPVFKDRPYNFDAIEQLLYEVLGGHSDLLHTSDGPTGREGPTYRHQWRYPNNGRIVDVFIGDPEKH